jgi:tetratricopeptide (TPR) repeat protein
MWWTVTGGLALSACLMLGAQGVLRTVTGQAIEGDIEERREDIVVTRKGMQQHIARNQVASINYLTTIAKELHDDLAKLPPEDWAGRVTLSRRAFDAGEYALARDLAQQALDINPNSREAVDMIDLARRQAVLELRAASATRPATQPREALHLLDDQEINVIRQFEVQDSDRRVRIKFLNDVKKRFASLPQRGRSFYELSNFQQAIAIINEGDLQMRRDVVIADDPMALREFKSLQRQILAGCGTVGCHAPGSGIGVVLFPMSENEAATYTNFYILSTYWRETNAGGDGAFGNSGTHYRMIDRQNPAQSLLLQYALPQAVADVPHPKAPGFRPMIQNRNDAMYNRVATWIGQTLRPVEPTYNLDYIPPVKPRPTSQPAATQPAAASRPSSPASRPAATSTSSGSTTRPSDVSPRLLPPNPLSPVPTTRPNLPPPPPLRSDPPASRPKLPTPSLR